MCRPLNIDVIRQNILSLNPTIQSLWVVSKLEDRFINVLAVIKAAVKDSRHARRTVNLE